MKSYPFEYSDHLQLVVVEALIGYHQVRLAIDTGASHTVIDLNDMIIAGYSPAEGAGSEMFETASGAVVAQTFLVREFSALGERRTGFPISSYDFLVNGVLSDINGILGLDFFADRVFCIDMAKKEISF